MAAQLPLLSRTLNLSGQPTNPVDLDPLFFPLEGAAATTFTYVADQGGSNPPQPGFTIQGAGATAWMTSAIPLAAFHNHPAAPATQLSVEWEQDISDPATMGGGPYFYHYSDNHYGTDGAGYFFRFNASSSVTNGTLFEVDQAGGTFTQLGGDFTNFADTWGRFRATLSRGSTGNTKRIVLEQFVSNAWQLVKFYDKLIDRGDMFGVAWRSTSTDSLSIRGPGGAEGPVFRFKAPSFVGVAVGQSEISGRAPGLQTGSNPNIYAVDRQGDFVSPMTDPWSGAQAAHATWSGITSESQQPGGSFGVEFAQRIRHVYPVQAWNVIAPKGGLAASDYNPPAASDRYNTGNRTGAMCLMTTILAGDGRTPGQRLIHFYWQGTRDANLGTAEAAYKSDVTALLDRLDALYPTSDTYMAIAGDRLYADPGINEAESQAIRNVHQQLILEGRVKMWFDDSLVVGPVGTNAGWNNPGDTLHPGGNDNSALTGIAAEEFLVDPGLTADSAPNTIHSVTTTPFRLDVDGKVVVRNRGTEKIYWRDANASASFLGAVADLEKLADNKLFAGDEVTLIGDAEFVMANDARVQASSIGVTLK